VDIHAYIQSGIIESYVLGLASTEEVVEVEELRNRYEEVEQAINEVSISIEDHSFKNAIAPPTELKGKIMAAIKEEEEQKVQFIPSILTNHGSSLSKETSSTGNVESIRPWQMAATASIILFICSAALNYYLYNKYSDKNKAYHTLVTERNTLQANNQLYQTSMKQWQSAAEMMTDPLMAKVELKSVKGSKEVIHVLWNTISKDVFVMSSKLPHPGAGKQYQLWALVDGKPVDAGVLDPNCYSVCKMKNILKAQAFAITLEKEGGSPTPDLQALYVMGKV